MWKGGPVLLVVVHATSHPIVGTMYRRVDNDPNNRMGRTTALYDALANIACSDAILQIDWRLGA